MTLLISSVFMMRNLHSILKMLIGVGESNEREDYSFTIPGQMVLDSLEQARKKCDVDKTLQTMINLGPQGLPLELDFSDILDQGYVEVSASPFFVLAGAVFSENKKV